MERSKMRASVCGSVRFVGWLAYFAFSNVFFAFSNVFMHELKFYIYVSLFLIFEFSDECERHIIYQFEWFDDVTVSTEFGSPIF